MISSRKTRTLESLRDEFHPTRNTLRFDQLTYGSGIKVWWLCSKSCCETVHEWKISINKRTSSGSGCPFCATRGRAKTCHCQSLGARFPDVARQIVDKNIDPFRLSPFSNKEFTFQCDQQCCDTLHKWTTRLCRRTFRGFGCPFCTISGNGMTCRCKSLGEKFPEIARQLVDRGIDPFSISYGSKRELEFSCDTCGRNWVASINNRTRYGGTGCPMCNVNKGESRLLDILDAHDRVAEHWKRAMECMDTYTAQVRHLTPDACGRTTTGRLFAIELDGPQHFESVNHFGNGKWTDLADQMRRDLAKNRTLWQNGYSLLRVSHLEFSNLDDIISNFITDVDTTCRQILRTSNDQKYSVLQTRARNMLE